MAIAGDLIPLNWTGFRGQTLWGWLNLLVLPAAITTVMALTSTRARRPGARLRPHHKTVIAALAAGWIVTVIGGYALRWRWTGYPGHTLGDRLGMFLSLVFPAYWSRPCSNGFGECGRARQRGIPGDHGPDGHRRSPAIAMRTHPRKTPRRRRKTAATSTVPSEELPGTSVRRSRLP